jgi:hypothetical protein
LLKQSGVWRLDSAGLLLGRELANLKNFAISMDDMNAEQQEVVARMVLQDLKRRGALQRQAAGGWRRGMSSFLVPVAISVVAVWGPDDRWVAASIVFGIALLVTSYELFWTNKRIDALLELHEQLERRIGKTQQAAASDVDRPLN